MPLLLLSPQLSEFTPGVVSHSGPQYNAMLPDMVRKCVMAIYDWPWNFIRGYKPIKGNSAVPSEWKLFYTYPYNYEKRNLSKSQDKR